MVDNNYNKLKKSYDTVRKSVLKKNREMQKVNDELDEIQKARAKMEATYKEAYAQEKNEAAKAYKTRVLEPIERNIRNAEKQLQSYRDEFASELAEITEENLAAQCSTQQGILDEVKDASVTLKERMEMAIGKRFYTELSQQLSTQKITLEQDNLHRVISYFNKCDRQLQKMTAKPDRIGTAVAGIEDTLQGLDGSSVTVDRKILAAVSVLLLVLVFFAYHYVFPFYVLLLSGLAVYNVYRSYLIYKIIIVHKAVQDNVKDIEELLHSQIREEVASRKIETEEFYNSKISSIENQIQKYKSQLTDASVTADNSFQFNDAQLREIYDGGVKRQEDKEMTLLQQKRGLKSELDSLTEDANEIKKELDKIIDGLKGDYLNFEKVGTSPLFQPNFLFDIDIKKSRPVFFEHPEKSCMILYDSREDAINFIKLLCVQIRASVSPKCYTMTYYDDKTLGRDCIFFVPEVTDKADAVLKLFQIKTEAEDLKSLIMDYAVDMRKRQKDLREDRTIKRYNEHMLEIESITMPYIFSFLLDPPSEVVKSPNAVLLLRTAGDYGIMLHLFYSLADFYEMGKGAKDIIESVDRIYVLQDGHYLERAKDFVMDKLVKNS